MAAVHPTISKAARCLKTEPQRAEQLLRQHLLSLPQSGQARLMLGQALLLQKRDNDACVELEALAKATKLPASAARQLAMLHNNLASRAIRNQAHEEARQRLRRAVELDPGNALAHFNLGCLTLKEKQLDQAAASLHRAAELAEGTLRTDSLLEVTRLYLLREDPKRAEQCLAESVQPNQAETDRQTWLRARLHDLNGEYQKGDALWKASMPEQPLEQLKHWLQGPLNIPSVWHDNSQVDAFRSSWSGRVQAFHAWAKDHADLLRDSQQAIAAWSPFFLAYQGRDDKAMLSVLGDAFAQLMPEPGIVRPASTSSTQRPHVVMVSRFLHDCTVGHYFLSWAEQLGRETKLDLIHLGTAHDHITERFAACGRLTQLANTSVDDARDQLLSLAPDCLLYLELGMDSRTWCLASQRLAPRQVCAWGHPNTTGLPSIDAYISFDAGEPAQAQEHYREQLLLQPGMGTRFALPDLPQAISRAQIGLPEEKCLILLPHNSFKLSPPLDSVIEALLSADEHHHLVLFQGSQKWQTEHLSNRLRSRLGQRFDQQHTLLEPVDRNRYLAICAVCDVQLDSIEFSGGNASLDALATGLPIVSFRGERMRGRQTAAMLEIMNAGGLVAESLDDYQSLALRLASDERERVNWREHLLRHREYLFERDCWLDGLSNRVTGATT